MAKYEQRRFRIMRGEIEIKNKKYNLDFSKGIDISIPINFNGEQPNTYGVKKATSKPYQNEQFIGDTRKGGPCNFETYSFTPHCNGTHTECIGHITDERISILSSLEEEIIPSTLISVTPKKTNENYNPDLDSEDLVITKKMLEKKLENIHPDFLKGIIIRTLPNSESKKNRDYMKEGTSFFSSDSMGFLVNLGVKHLLVDIPSVDPLLDNGLLSAHNIFWGTQGGNFNHKSKNKTITEMIFVPNYVKDGSYILNLQIPAFVSDAAASRPILYKINDL